MPRPIVDLQGKQFGRLRVHWPVGIRRHVHWLTSCRCGGLKIVAGHHLTTGMVRSCGCLRVDCGKEMSARIPQLRHGHAIHGAITKTFRTWDAMRQRCLNPRCNKYKDYGGRGIKICERWNRFENFLADMGERPLGKTIDRFPDNDGNYEPSNCRWATPLEQAHNKVRKAVA
jgi:hypothetical protein